MAPLLKDQINRGIVGLLAEKLHASHKPFDTGAFTQTAMSGLDDLELKDRINRLADAMAEYLPSDYNTALDIVLTAAEDGIEGWAAWPLCSFVERHGTDHPEASLLAMPTLTKLCSCEFAIRPYLTDHLALAVSHMRRWVHDEDEAVRRLVSEGSRPRLPWGPKVPVLIDDPQIGMEFLAVLRHDPSETVRRSVANHLNDVAKSQPDLVVQVLSAWTGEAEPVDDAMVRHALRTLVKNGHPGALKVLGFTTEPEVSVANFSCSPVEVGSGDQITLTASLTSTSTAEQHLVIDFVIHHVNASGATSPKVFKWTNQRLAPMVSAELTKRRKIQHASTRTYYPGHHRVDLQIAGQCVATTHFDFTAS